MILQDEVTVWRLRWSIRRGFTTIARTQMESKLRDRTLGYFHEPFNRSCVEIIAEAAKEKAEK